jgi:hypothetical protein
MKAKKQYVALPFMLLLAAAAASCIPGTRWDVHLSVEKTKPYKTNLVGIAGPPSSEPYVEIIYSADDGQGQGKNKTESLMVSPPYIFENSRVNVTYDSTVYGRKKHDEYYALTLKRSYEEGGADYFRIVNHSTDKTVEFFLAGAQDVATSEENGKIYAEVLPSVLYRYAPIYYLLYPDKKYHQNVIGWENVYYFEGSRCGDLALTSAWSVDEVMQLYRAEYRQSADTILYETIPMAAANIRMTDKSEYKWGYRKFYGAIPPGEEFKGNEAFWMPATPFMFETLLKQEDY